MTTSNNIEYLDLVNDNDGEVLLPMRDSTRRIFPNCYDFSCEPLTNCHHGAILSTQEKCYFRSHSKVWGFKTEKVHALGSRVRLFK